MSSLIHQGQSLENTSQDYERFQTCLAGHTLNFLSGEQLEKKKKKKTFRDRKKQPIIYFRLLSEKH